MATYRVMTWRGIPAQVKASDESGVDASNQMPPFFQQEIDRVAMSEGLLDSDEYLEDWKWSEELEREGSAQEVADAVVIELVEEWNRRKATT